MPKCAGDGFLDGENEILFVADIARLLDVSPTTVRRPAWRRDSGIPFRKVGKKLCFSRVELVNWWQGRTVDS